MKKVLIIYFFVLCPFFSFSTDTIFFENIRGQRLKYALCRDAVIVFGTELICKGCFTVLSDYIKNRNTEVSKKTDIILILALPDDAKRRREMKILYSNIFPISDTVFYDELVPKTDSCKAKNPSRYFCQYSIDITPAILLISPKNKIFRFISNKEIFANDVEGILILESFIEKADAFFD